MINVTKTYLPDVEKYKLYVEKIFSSGWITNYGQLVQQLENRLQDYLGVKNVVLVANGTLALQVAYRLLGLKGDIVTTPFSFVATVSSQVWEGLNPVFADIDKETLNIDCSKIEKSITEKTSGIVPVHVFGNGCEVERIQEIAHANNLKLIYDAAHAFGVKYKGTSILNYGDISILSFHATKIFHTIEGGALIINDDKLCERARLMINFGIPGPDSVIDLGINAKMNEFQAAMGHCILDDMAEIMANRKKVYEYYMSNLPDCLTFQKRHKDCTLNYGHFPVVFDSEQQLLRVKKKLEDENIMPRRYFYPSLEGLPYIEKKQSEKISKDICGRILCLPMFPSLQVEDQDRIIKIIKENL